MKTLFFLLRQFCFWLLFFAVNRAVFIFYNHPFIKTEEISAGEVFQAFWNALPVDISTASYIIALSLLISFLYFLVPGKWMMIIHKTVSFIIIMAFAIITAGELGIYPEWKTKLSAKALLYLRNPTEVYASASFWSFLSLFLITVVMTLGSWYIYRRFVINKYQPSKHHILIVIPSFLILACLAFIGMRGGINAIPISPSAAYFSPKNFLNHAAVNPGFNLAISMLESNKFKYENPFSWMDQDEAESIVQALLQKPSDSARIIINKKNPNVVILLMESWTADLIESLGGEPGITPQFAELEKKGILFTNFYSTGSRSQQAIAAIVGGFPATPYTTVTENPEKYAQLPSLVKMLNVRGYHTSFYFGGKLTYGNIKAYLYSNEFDRVIEQKDFDKAIPSGRLGIHDEHLFDRHIHDMQDVEEPFFSIVFTLSSHSPYDQPMENVFDWGGNENDFINSAYYTDMHLGRYFDEAKKQEWYENTLFIIVADHSHNSYRNWPLTSFEYHRVPLMFLGDVVLPEYRGTQFGNIGCNTDISSTLINQLGMDPSPFPWSKDLFNPGSAEYAFFELHFGFGWKTPKGCFVYSWDWDHYYQEEYIEGLNKAEKNELINEGRAYLQVIFQAFLDL